MKNIAYLKLNWLSIFLIFMLFVIGGLVRSTGSGMGCPDWPKCFGEYIPPISESELPADYEAYFKDQRLKKTKRFTALLDRIGFDEKADAIRNDTQVEQSHKFNVVKAYIEYINRLLGALTGIVVFICFLLSLKYVRSNPIVFWYTLAGFIFVFINALLGAIVVHSNLIGSIVTIHFIAAFASICFFLLARRYARVHEYNTVDKKTKQVGLIMMVLSTIQVILGAEVRELYDLLPTLGTAAAKIDGMYPTIQWHAAFGAIVLVVSIYQFITAQKGTFISQYSRWIMLMCIGQILWGPMALLESTESISKLFHITLGAGIFVLQFYICTSYLRQYKKA